MSQRSTTCASGPPATSALTADEFSLQTVLWPRLRGVLARYPDIKLEIETDYRLVRHRRRRFDAGVRLGDIIAKDMIAVPITPAMRMLVVATPGYFARAGRPRTPQELAGHCCINLRLPTLRGALYLGVRTGRTGTAGPRWTGGRLSTASSISARRRWKASASPI